MATFFLKCWRTWVRPSQGLDPQGNWKFLLLTRLLPSAFVSSSLKENKSTPTFNSSPPKYQMLFPYGTKYCFSVKIIHFSVKMLFFFSKSNTWLKKHAKSQWNTGLHKAQIPVSNYDIHTVVIHCLRIFARHWRSLSV